MSAIPKNGSNSIREVMRGQPVSNKEVLQIPQRVAWIRNWEKRLVSAYSFFKTIVDNGGEISSNAPTENYEQFVDYILSAEDEHWLPQTELLTYQGAFLPTVTHRFEDINHLWGQYYDGFIPHLNGCVHKIVKDYRRQELETYYSKDNELWLSL